MYVMGTESFKDYLRTFGFNVTEEAEDDVEIVLCGFDRELTYKKLKGCANCCPKAQEAALPLTPTGCVRRISDTCRIAAACAG